MPHATAVERVTAALRDEILSGALAPGSPLREESAAERFDVSRHTVRAAFQRLVAERLAEAVAYRGVRVTSFDRAQVVALQQLRAALESEAVRIASDRFGGRRWPASASQGAEAALARLERLARGENGAAGSTGSTDSTGSTGSTGENAGADSADSTDSTDSTAGGDRGVAAADWLEVERIHAEFHRALVEASGSARIIEAHAALGSELLLFLLHVRPHYSLEELVVEHRELLDAVQRPDGDEAVRAHLAGSTALLFGGADEGAVSEPGSGRTPPRRVGA